MIQGLAGLVLSLVSIAFGVAAAPLDASDIIGILRTQGFSSSLDSGTTLRHVGNVVFAKIEFEIYLYDHVNLENHHGLTKIVVIQNDEKYAGSYLIDADDLPLQVRAADILFPGSLGKIHFSSDGPPQKAFANGDNLELEK